MLKKIKINKKGSNNTFLDIMIHFSIMFVFGMISSIVIFLWLETTLGILFVSIAAFLWGLNALIVSKINPDTARIFLYKKWSINQGFLYMVNGIALFILWIIIILIIPNGS